MKKATILLVMVFMTTIFTPAKAQDLPSGMTVLALQEFVNKTINNLKNAGTTILGNGQITMLSASNDLSVLLSQVNSLAQTNFTKPINEMSFEIRNLSSQLYSAANRMNIIVDQQQACLVLNASIVIAGVQNVTSELKSGVPFVGDDSPRINYFQFEGKTPSIVPEAGGRVNVLGFRLWKDKKAPPIVELYDNERKLKIKDIQPERASNDNAFSLIMTKETITANAGKCLQLKVIVRQRSFWGKISNVGEYWTPFCIPNSYGKEIFVKAYLDYQCTNNKTETTPDSKDFNFDNHSCTDRANIDNTQCWSLPANAQILRLLYSPESRNDNNVSVNFIGNCVKVTGWIDEASCFEGPFGIKKKLHHAYWRTSVKAEYTYPKTETLNSGIVSSDKVLPNSSDVILFVNLPKSCENKLNSLFWFEVYQVNGNENTLIYKSANTSDLSVSDSKGGMLIDAKLNPIPTNGNAQLSVKLTFPKCGL